MNMSESQERKLHSTMMMASPPSYPHHLVEELNKAQRPPVLETLAARMLMMTIMNNKNEEDERSVTTSTPHTIAPEEELESYHHQQQQHSSYSYQEEHQIRHEVPSTPPSTPPPRPLIWQSETDIALRRALIREIVAIVNHWKKQHINYNKKKHLLDPTTTDRRLRVPKLFPQLFQQLEAALYTSAPTKDAFVDKDTLQQRLMAVSVRNKCFGRLEARSWSYFLQMGKNACRGCE